MLILKIDVVLGHLQQGFSLKMFSIRKRVTSTNKSFWIWFFFAPIFLYVGSTVKLDMVYFGYFCLCFLLRGRISIRLG